MNPLSILKEAIKALPAMKYALGVLGLVAVLAIVSAWQVQFRVAALGGVVILGMMVAVLVFARLTRLRSTYFLRPAILLMWTSVALTVATGALLFTAAAFRWPRPFSDLLFGVTSPGTKEAALGSAHPATNAVDSHTIPTPPAFVTQLVFPPERIERDEFVLEQGRLSGENIDEFLRLTRLAFGTINKTNRAFQVDFTIKNTSTEPFLLDLDERFFGMDDDQGRAARLIYFCCPAKGELLSTNSERTVQLFFENAGWYGKGLSAHWIFVRVRGFLPVVSASWKARTLATRD